MSSEPTVVPRSARILIVDDNAAIHADFQKVLAVESDGGLQALEADLFGTAPAPQRSDRLSFALDSAFQGEEALARMRRAYAQDVGVLPAAEIASIIAAGGFELPVQFFQAGLIHGWVSRRG